MSTPSLKRSRDSSSPSPRPSKKSKSGPLVFFSRSGDDEAKQLSNFAPSWIQIDSRWYPTVEHYYQSRKFVGRNDLVAQFGCDERGGTPTVGSLALNAKRAGSKTAMKMIKFALSPDWDTKSLIEMKKAALVKFTEHEYSRDCLLRTLTRPLHHYERRPGVWGCHTNHETGGLKKGGNALGRILEEIRSDLQVVD